MKTLRNTILTVLVLLLAVAPMACAEERGPLALTEKEHYAVNLFLSNFTEIGVDEISTYEFEDKPLVDFAHDHLWFNDYDSFEYGEYFGGNNCRVSDDRIQEIIDKYFLDPRTVDLSLTRFDYDGEYYYHTETGGWINDGFAMNTSVCPIEDNYYYVSFMIFAGGELWENTALNLSIAEAWEQFGHPCGYGSALIYAEDLSNRSTYKMINYGTI